MNTILDYGALGLEVPPTLLACTDKVVNSAQEAKHSGRIAPPRMSGVVQNGAMRFAYCTLRTTG